MKPARINNPADYIDIILDEMGSVEIIHQSPDNRFSSRIHDDIHSAIQHIDKTQWTGNLYTSLNQFGRAHPQTKRVGNDDVIRCRRILFDFDPIRPKGQPSTNHELFNAKIAALDCRDYLTKLGLPEPAIGMSGNGYHLLYRCDYENTLDRKHIMAELYKAMEKKFSDEDVSFDRCVSNPGRICCLYGTIKRKGTATLERPNRQSYLEVPVNWEIVSEANIRALIGHFVPKPPKPKVYAKGPVNNGDLDFSRLDIVSWFRANGHYKRRCSGHVHAVRCPWADIHSDGRDEAFIFEANGRYPSAYFQCKHDSCIDKNTAAVADLWGDAKNFC